MHKLFRRATALLETKPSTYGPQRQESDLEHKARNERHFYEWEAVLPNVKAFIPDDRPTFATNLFSYLGSFNPIGVQVTPKNTVWLLDNTAYRNPITNNWEAEIVTAVFDKNTGLEISTVVADLAEKLGIGEGDEAEARIRDRLMPFMQTILPGRIVNINFADSTLLKCGPGGRNGISCDIKPLPPHLDGEVVNSPARVPHGANGILEMRTVFAEPEGWAVISDIDDTIKITQTGSPIGILRATFVDDATPVKGMPELYTYIQSLISASAPWFYLSASPYNLYPFLSQFRERYYPHGTLILRDASWMNLAGLLSNLTLGTQEYKVDRMEKVNSWLPKRKLILIGDSTQADPEAYGEIYRQHNDWVKCILIRRVDDISAVGIEERNKAPRFEKAFKHVPKDIWHVFDDPGECFQILSDAVARG